MPDPTGPPPSTRDLPTRWRADAEDLRHYGAEPQALTLERAADDLETALRAGDDELLTPAEAAAVSGYSVDHLCRLIRGRRVRSAGRLHAPLIRRADLPRKPSRSLVRAGGGSYDPIADARSLGARRNGGANV